MKESSILFLCLAFASLVYIGDASGYCHYTYCGYSGDIFYKKNKIK